MSENSDIKNKNERNKFKIDLCTINTLNKFLLEIQMFKWQKIIIKHHCDVMCDTVSYKLLLALYTYPGFTGYPVAT